MSFNKVAFYRILVFLIGLTIITLSFFLGKNNLFLIFNSNLGSFANTFFFILTLLGDAFIWIPFLIYIFVKRRALFFLTIASFILVTIVVQGVKRLPIGENLRPYYSMVAERNDIHSVYIEEPNFFSKTEFLHKIWEKFLVEEFTPNQFHSFPSGHASTIFSIFLICILFVESSIWLFIFFILTLAIGYSRIYLAQHFPIDIAGGMLAALLVQILVDKVFKLRPKQNKKSYY